MELSQEQTEIKSATGDQERSETPSDGQGESSKSFVAICSSSMSQVVKYESSQVLIVVVLIVADCTDILLEKTSSCVKTCMPRTDPCTKYWQMS